MAPIYEVIPGGMTHDSQRGYSEGSFECVGTLKPDGVAHVGETQSWG